MQDLIGSDVGHARGGRPEEGGIGLLGTEEQRGESEFEVIRE